MKEEYYYWPADLLARYVVKAHHREILQMLPKIKGDFAQLTSVYGTDCPKLREAHSLFVQCVQEIEAHFSKEATTVLTFAGRYIKELKKRRDFRKPGLYSVCPSVHQMYIEHKTENLRFDLMLHLMGQVITPPKSSFLYETTYRQLHELRSQWQAQVQLENDILFPKIIEMEATLNPLGS